MESLNPGTTVYFCWYDFQHKKEHTLTGEVVDNSDYQDTQWADFVYVRFQPSCVSAPIHHHFLPERLSTDQSNVPHDDCYLMLQSSVPSAEVEPQQNSKANPWLLMTEFKNQHWDTEHNHIHVDALNEFYRLWRIAINWRIGKEIKEEYTKYPQFPKHPFVPEWNDWNNGIKPPSIEKTIKNAMDELKTIKSTIVSDEKMTELKEQLKEAVKPVEPKKNPEVIQLDLFS